jgi:hypothetical protein
LSGTVPLAAPEIPVVQSNFQLGLGGFVQPPAFALREIAFHCGNFFLAAQMNIRGFPPHVVKQALFVAFLGK